MTQPDIIRHYSEIQDADDACYPGSSELHSIGSPFSRVFGFERIGIHHEFLPPGRRTSWPHCEKTEEEFVYVLEGHPDVWINGNLRRLNPGDGVGFKPGSGIAHTFINNTAMPVRLLVVGEHRRADNKIHYPMHPDYNREIGSDHWDDVPQQVLGGHNGLPDQAG